MTGMVETLTFRTDRMRALAASGYSTATDLADWLVREAGLPFREAHHVVGACVKRAEELVVELSALPAADAAAIHAAVTPDVLAALTVAASVASRIDRKRVVSGKSASVRVDLGGTPFIKKTQYSHQRQAKST